MPTLPRNPSRVWSLPPASIAVRLFLTCWIVYTLHFATDIVREIYPAVALGDSFSFRLDEYAGLHPDIFEKEGYGWHIGNNPGVSMLAAVPYAVSRPVLDRIVERVRASRAASGEIEPPAYDSEWENERRFFEEAWRRGLDVKLGLAAFVMQAFCMAPLVAFSVAVMFLLLRRLLESQRAAGWLSLLYGLGTPVFFRAGFLNHNLLLGVFAFMAFLAMWSSGPRAGTTFRPSVAYLLGGVAGGVAVLFDYSGVVFLLGLFAYGVWTAAVDYGPRRATRLGAVYALGSIGPVGLLLLYQWRSFGNPFLPGQHWMPPVEWIDLGYQGYGAPQFELLWALAFDYRFGLFVTCPLLLLAFAYPLLNRDGQRSLPLREYSFILVLFAALWLFFSGSNYTRLQFNTGVRYMMPIVPFLFVPAALALLRLPRVLIFVVAVVSVVEAWCLAMVREVERPLGVFDPVVRVLVEGFQLPALRTIARSQGYYGGVGEGGVSPLPLFLLAAVLVFGIWVLRFSKEEGAP